MRHFKYNRLTLLIGLLLAASLACNLGGSSQSKQATPIPTLFPTLTPSATAFGQTPTPTATPTATAVTLPNATGVPGTQIGCIAQATWPVYTVVAGDTLGVIAQRTGTTTAQLVSANCLTNSELIYVGQKLYVPSLPVTITLTPTPTLTQAPPANAPIIQQSLDVKPVWYDNSGKAVTYSDTVRINLGEVLNADSVAFYVNDPSGGPSISIGQDTDPYDGAFVDYTFPAAGSYTFQGIAKNEAVQAVSTTFTVRYDPNFSPPGGQRNQLTISPYVQFDGGWYTLQIGATVSITWPDAPAGATRIDFTITPTGTNTADAAQVIGTDLTPANGAAITWGVQGGILGHLQAVATMPDGSQQSSELANIVTDN